MLQPHHGPDQWVIPPEQNGEFVAAMEDVLEVYHRPRDPTRPQINLDEQPVQLIKQTRVPWPAAPGRPAREDYEYERAGTANLFLLFAPLEGRRHVVPTERRTKQDFARVIKHLVDERYPEAEKVVLVMDNLNTHRPAALYETFAPAEARRLLDRLEIHYTPKHGSWLNVAESELAALKKGCLARRIGDRGELTRELRAWVDRRNDAKVGADWRFTTAQARIKLHRLYPSTDR